MGTATPGASIRYTTNGSTPSETVGTLYSAPITVSATTTIKAIAYESGMPDSAVSTATFTISSSNWYSASWTDRMPITINHGKVAGTTNLTNFPVLVSLTNANLATVANGGSVANSNGNDILFTASDGLTKLNHQIESYNAATGQLIAWVQVPTVSPTGDAVIYIYYANPAATNQQNPTGVWDSNFQQVLHLDESSGTTLFDSTTYGNNGSKVSPTSPTPTASGEIGGAQSFNGTSDYAVLPPSMTNGLTMFSVSFWAQTTDTVGNGTYWNQPQFVGDASNGSNSGDFGIVTNNGDLGMWSGLNSGGDNALVTSDLISDNNWHHISAVNNGSVIWLYLDGQYTGQFLSSGEGLDSLGWYLGAAAIRSPAASRTSSIRAASMSSDSPTQRAAPDGLERTTTTKAHRPRLSLSDRSKALRKRSAPVALSRSVKRPSGLRTDLTLPHRAAAALRANRNVARRLPGTTLVTDGHGSRCIPRKRSLFFPHSLACGP